ncbi:DUF6020 family protein [Bifidobacterium sp. ESL0764]|uniref:DUF6020 family protein n=1 Tax=Bifidobacterium sp. ESL0764 TaxID=2983228 RepID=UPI0023F90BAF|nr:DUF6020 family protein [Bifidobacterium sp. ESL0764]WEV66095.1 DUF6020 family protein [Bifidobacterium sp. ESL0764]
MNNSEPTNAANRQNDGEPYSQASEGESRPAACSYSATNDPGSTADTDTSTKSATSTRFGGLFAFLRWALAVAASLWIAVCTSLGPLYRQYELNPAIATIRAFSWNNAAIFAGTFVICMAVIVELVRFGRGQCLIPYDFGIRAKLAARRERRRTRKLANSKARNLDTGSTSASSGQSNGRQNAKLDNRLWLRTRIRQRIGHIASGIRRGTHRGMMAATDKWWKIALILIIGWLWVPITLVAAFGADIRSQFREFSWAWNQWTGMRQPYIGFFSFVPMDIYPTAHYLWPAKPTYLTDQHNIVLTLIYGAAGTVSRYFTGSNDWGIVVLASGQLLFAAFCLAATANRFFNHPWLKPRKRLVDLLSASSCKTGRPDFQTEKVERSRFVGPLPRFFILLFFLVCPLVLFSTISLTKSPLFAFAFVWWFGVGYEVLCTAKSHRPRPSKKPTSPATSRKPDTIGDSEAANAGGANDTATDLDCEPSYDRIVLHLRKRTFIALFLSTVVMMISAKYAIYIILFELVIALLADRKRWKTYIIGMLLPVIAFQGAVGLATRDGAIINGDPIESHGVQLQQIARVAVLNPNGIPQDARNKLAPIFNLDQMAEAYYQQDADPVKSSGIQTKRVSYRWRTVTKKDMKNFNAAWLEIVKANPRIALDALLAKSYGYFDIMDPPYIDMTYYVVYAGNGNFTDWIGNWCSDWRKKVTNWAKDWSSKPMLGWLTHGNSYVIFTLLLGAAEVILRRWKTLATHLPLLLLMGVMVTSPANNFERHMLPLVFVLGFVLLTFWQDSRIPRTQARARQVNGVDNADTAGVADKPDTAVSSICGIDRLES